MYDLAKYDVKAHKTREGRVRHYPSVLRAIKRLRRSELVEIKDRRKGRKGARTILYTVTLPGLARIMPSLNIREIRQVAEKHRDLLPQVFDLWPSFLEHKQEDLAARRLQSACTDTRKEDIVRMFLNPYIVAVDNPDAWNGAIRANGKLKDATVGFLRHDILRKMEETSTLLKLLAAPELGLTQSPEEQAINLEATSKALLISEAFRILAREKRRELTTTEKPEPTSGPK